MKKTLIISLCLMLTLGLAACGTPPPQSSAPSASLLPTPEPSPAPGSESSSAPDQPKRPNIPADAAMYRGTVVEVLSATPAADGKAEPLITVTLEQAEGTNFGSPSLKFAFTSNTQADFTPEKGQYLEVYYGAAMGQPLDTEKVHGIITAIRYPEADMVNYNGYVKAIETRSSNPTLKGAGRLIMVSTPEESSDGASSDIPAMNEIHYNFDDSTQFYLNFDELKAGDHLNIFRSGAMTMSLPPQCYAIEVRPYK